MKIFIALLATVALTTGFTCSKNPPAETAAPAQDQMAAPAETAAPETAAPAAEMPADVTTTTMHQ